MDSFVTDTQALVKFMMGQKVINEISHQAFLSADRGESIIIIPASQLPPDTSTFRSSPMTLKSGLLHLLISWI